MLTINGSKGVVYEGDLPLVAPTASGDYARFLRFMSLVDKYRTMGVRANADNPADAQKAREFGAEGIGLFRTEHMFYGEGSAKPLFLLRKMILCTTQSDRISVLNELFPFMKKDIKETMLAMDGFPVTIRLLDPPLHEFVPHSALGRQELSSALGIAEDEVRKRVDALQENNPMMGHRGVRLSVTYPEITEYQARAILESAASQGRAGRGSGEVRGSPLGEVHLSGLSFREVRSLSDDLLRHTRQFFVWRSALGCREDRAPARP